jgi:hypothetical protein
VRTEGSLWGRIPLFVGGAMSFQARTGGQHLGTSCRLSVHDHFWVGNLFFYLENLYFSCNMIRYIAIIFLLASSLWAKKEYFILPVQLQGVHEDYAEKITSLVKEYAAIDGFAIVSKKEDCDYLLQIKLLREEFGVAVIFEKRKKNDKVVWSYGHIAYTPNDFIPIVSHVSHEIK